MADSDLTYSLFYYRWMGLLVVMKGMMMMMMMLLVGIPPGRSEGLEKAVWILFFRVVGG